MAPPAEKKKKHSSADHRLISPATDTNPQKLLGSFETEDGERRSVRIGMKKNRRYIDHSVITFLRAIQQVFDKGTDLDLPVVYPHNAKKVQPIWNDFTREIWPIFAKNIRHLSLSNGHYLDDLRLHTSPTILSDLDISTIHSDYLLPDSIADDGPNATAGQALSKWLQIPTKNGQPKRLSCHGATSRTSKFVNNFKEAFLRANSSASYVIRIEYFESTPIEPFELKNERTNEMLTLEKDDENLDEEDDDGGKYIDLVLKRCQIGKKTIQWEDEKTDNLNNVKFHLYEFGYIDHSVIAFLRANQQIWDKCINLRLIVSSHNNNNYNNVQRILHVYVHAILPIFAPNIRHLILPDGVDLDKLLHLTSPKMLFDLNIHSIDAGRLFPNAIDYGTLLLNEIGELDKPYSYYVGQALYKWLYIPTKDGQPKQLRCCTFTSEIIELVSNFKEAFLHATTSSASYQIQFTVSAPTEIAPFQLVNERTSEMLTMEKGFRRYGSVDWLIKRCPIGGTTAALKWKDENLDDFNNVIITLYGNCIGPLSPPAEEAGQSIEKETSSDK